LRRTVESESFQAWSGRLVSPAASPHPAASTAQAVPVDTVAPSGELLCDAKDQALIYEETSLHLRMGDAQAV
jgi:hypothetical protein